MTIHALTDAEFATAAADAGYVRNGNPCDVPGVPLSPLENAICDSINAREALRAAEAIAIAFDESPAWGPPPSQGAVDRRRRITATLRRRRSTYELKLANVIGEIE
ncbi:MAG: hypothetical protein ACR2OE_11135 [Thermomicrobiales bacterium]